MIVVEEPWPVHVQVSTSALGQHTYTTYLANVHICAEDTEMSSNTANCNRTVLGMH